MLPSTNRLEIVCVVVPSCHDTSAPSSPPRMALTPAPRTISAPPSCAARATLAVTAPMPPTGTRSSPVPLPIRW